MRVPVDLVEQLAKRQVVAFVGSGLSMACGLPDWRTLLDALTATCLDDVSKAPVDEVNELNRLSRGSPLEMLMAAQELRERLRPSQFKEFMEKVFESPGLEPAEVHSLLTRLPFGAVLTTNYDKLLEVAYGKTTGGAPRVFTQRHMPALASLLSDRNFYILKIHGDIDDIETIVLGLGDYRQLSHSNLACRIALEALLREKTVLFMGYGLNDPDFVLLLDEVRNTFQGWGRLHYALMDTDRLGPIARRRFEQDFGIRILPYSPSSPTHPEVAEFLRALSRAARSTDKTKKVRTMRNAVGIRNPPFTLRIHDHE